MSERVSLERNIERLAGLWPSAGFSHDWIALFRKEFRDANQHWLAEAMESVKRSKASHVPELKWFIEEFREVGRRFSAAGREPETLQGKAKARAEAEERERREVEAEHRTVLAELSALPQTTLEELRKRMSEIPYLRPFAAASTGPVEEWKPLARGMAWALLHREGMR
jgi:hypothetical protein